MIDIKNVSPRCAMLRRHQTEVAMPIDSILVSAAVVTVFVIFAGVLIRADLQSGSIPPQPLDPRPKRRSF
ncbi:MAG TPA: hypothetical protein VE865_15905 [Bradyrhizobium sp.]|nr:hypothetical protein [Bradyrhizobium sp.]